MHNIFFSNAYLILRSAWLLCSSFLMMSVILYSKSLISHLSFWLFVLRFLVIPGCSTLSSGSRGASVCHCTKHQGDSHRRASISSNTLLVNAIKFIYLSAVPLIFPQTTGPNLKCANPASSTLPPSGGSTVWCYTWVHIILIFLFLKKSFSHILAHKAPAPAFVAWASI